MFKMKVAIYCRVSTEEQNPKIQERICKEYCDRMGHEVYKIYTDVFTGTKSKRPAFNELLKDMRSMKFRGIVISKLDRIGRSLSNLLDLIEEFKNRRTEFVVVQQNIDTTTSTGKLMLQVMGAFAEFESNIISERTKDGLRGNTRVGKRGPDKKPRKKRGGKKDFPTSSDLRGLWV